MTTYTVTRLVGVSWGTFKWVGSGMGLFVGQQPTHFVIGHSYHDPSVPTHHALLERLTVADMIWFRRRAWIALDRGWGLSKR